MENIYTPYIGFVMVYLAITVSLTTVHLLLVKHSDVDYKEGFNLCTCGAITEAPNPFAAFTNYFPSSSCFRAEHSGSILSSFDFSPWCNWGIRAAKN